MKPPVILIAGGVAALALVVMLRNREAAQQLGGAVVDAVDGVISGGVVAIGERVGIPATNQTQFERDMAAGRYWDASFSGTAKQYFTEVVPASMSAIWNGTIGRIF